MSDLEIFVNSKINKNKLVMFAKAGCPFCDRAKQVLSQYRLKKGTTMEIVNLRDRDAARIQDYLFRLTGSRTVPRIFIDRKAIGGSDELMKLKNNGKLAKMLEG